MSYILTPNGRRPIVPINESAEQVNDTEMDIDLDVEHFLDYVMENFPELTEKYIEENYEQVDEISLKTKMNAYKAARDPEADYSYGSKVHSQGDRLRSKIVAKHGEKAGDHADRAAYGKPSTPATRSAEKSKPDSLTHNSTNKMRTTKSGVANKQDQKSNAAVIKSRIGKHGKSNLPEDIEYVDELSHDTLRNYRAAARSDRQHTQRFPAYMIKGDPKLQHSIIKRGDSLSLAGKKLGIPGYQSKAKVLAKD